METLKPFPGIPVLLPGVPGVIVKNLNDPWTRIHMDAAIRTRVKCTCPILASSVTSHGAEWPRACPATQPRSGHGCLSWRAIKQLTHACKYLFFFSHPLFPWLPKVTRGVRVARSSSSPCRSLWRDSLELRPECALGLPRDLGPAGSDAEF